MGDPKGFLKHTRETPTSRPVEVRLKDWREIPVAMDDEAVATQASRCMNCGIPFCNHGCPLGNLIPDWNHLVYTDRWQQASERLHATNNFPEFTGRLCPAPCEPACVVAIDSDAVTIKNVELSIIEKAWQQGWVKPIIPSARTGKKVAIVGSGPAALATAQQLTRAGHAVTVYERADRIGGLLRYGIPEFKMEKHILDRRLQQMKDEGTTFVTNATIGGSTDNTLALSQLREEFDVVVLAAGSTDWRELPIAGRELEGVFQAMQYLPMANKVQHGDIDSPAITAAGKAVVVIGGGDTGADCVGTANRQGARSVTQFEIMPQPPKERNVDNPWPTWPLIARTSSAHAEGVQRRFCTSTIAFKGNNGSVTHLQGHEVRLELAHGKPDFQKIPGSEFEIEAELVLLAMGFVGAEANLVDQLGIDRDDRNNPQRSLKWKAIKDGTELDDVFICGDMGRGQSLIVWAIAEGRSCAAAVDQHLMGYTDLPAPVKPTDRPLS